MFGKLVEYIIWMLDWVVSSMYSVIIPPLKAMVGGVGLPFALFLQAVGNCLMYLPGNLFYNAIDKPNELNLATSVFAVLFITMVTKLKPYHKKRLTGGLGVQEVTCNFWTWD